MEWVETTARTIDEAKSLALDQLGVDTDDAEFEILDEPRPGLFGRLRGEARVRARVRPNRPRAKVERRGRERRRRPRDEDGGTSPSTDGRDAGDVDGAAADIPSESATEPATRSTPRRRAPRSPRPSTTAPPEGDTDMSEPTAPDAPDTPDTGDTESSVDPATVGQEATVFLDGLLDAFGLSGEVSCTQDGIELDLRVDGSDLGLLVGPRGSTLLAVQDLTRVVSQRRLGDHETRLRVDVAGYRERRREALSRFAITMADEVAASGVARVLEPMASADRKVIHDVLATRDDVTTRSEGDDPYRRVVVDPVA